MKQQGMFFIKRLFDVIVSAAGLILLSPLLALLAVLVRINLGAPIFSGRSARDCTKRSSACTNSAP